MIALKDRVISMQSKPIRVIQTAGVSREKCTIINGEWPSLAKYNFENYFTFY